MLNIQINDPELELSIRQAYGNNTDSLARDFVAFIRQEKIRDDIRVSIQQLDSGEGVPLKAVMQEIRSRYE